MSLALGIVSILGACWTLLHILSDLHFTRSIEFYDENITSIELAWASYSEAMGLTVEALFAFYSFVGAIIFIVMSVLAGAALRSTKSQAIVVMTTTSTTTPAE